MPTQEIALTDKEKEIVQEVQKSLGHETIEYLARQRIQELLGKLAGQELRKRNRHLF